MWVPQQLEQRLSLKLLLVCGFHFPNWAATLGLSGRGEASSAETVMCQGGWAPPKRRMGGEIEKGLCEVGTGRNRKHIDWDVN